MDGDKRIMFEIIPFKNKIEEDVPPGFYLEEDVPETGNFVEEDIPEGFVLEEPVEEVIPKIEEPIEEDVPPGFYLEEDVPETGNFVEEDIPPGFYLEEDVPEEEPILVEGFRNALKRPTEVVRKMKQVFDELTNKMGEGVTLGLSNRASEWGKNASDLVLRAVGIEPIEEPETEDILPGWVGTGAELVGETVPVGAAGKLIAVPIAALLKKSRYLRPLANITGWGVAGGTYESAKSVIKTSELPTKEEIAVDVGYWAGMEAVLSSFGHTGRFAALISRSARKENVAKKVILKRVIDVWKKDKKKSPLNVAKNMFIEEKPTSALIENMGAGDPEFKKNAFYREFEAYVKEIPPEQMPAGLGVPGKEPTLSIGKTMEDTLPIIPKETPSISTLKEVIPEEVAIKKQNLWDRTVIAFAKAQAKKILDIPVIGFPGRMYKRVMDVNYKPGLSQPEKYLKLLKDKKRSERIGADYAMDLGNRLNALSEESSLKLGQAITTKGKDYDKIIKGLTVEEQALVKEAKDMMLTLGHGSVETGLLSEKTFFKNAGRYMPRLYELFEKPGLYAQLCKHYNIAPEYKIIPDRQRHRNEKLTKKQRESMGEILTPAYPITKGGTQLSHNVATAKFLTQVAENPEWVYRKERSVRIKLSKSWKEIKLEYEALKKQKISEGWKRLDNNKKYGDLAGATVHPEIHRDIMEAFRVSNDLTKAWRSCLGNWKFGKVILSPKTHMRNVESNSILAHIGDLPMPRQPEFLGKSFKSLRTKNKYYQMAWEEGLFSGSYVQGDIDEFLRFAQNIKLDGKQIGSKSIGTVIGEFWRLEQEWMKLGLKKTPGKRAADMYQASEHWFKLAKMIHSMEERGMTAKEAVADAHKWLFNYAELTKFQQMWKNIPIGAPFATFCFKAIPRFFEVAATRPNRLVLPFMAVALMEEQSRKMLGDTWEQTEAKRELIPEWMSGSINPAAKHTPVQIQSALNNFVRMPFVDDDGREYYLNLSYIFPWGDIGEGGSLWGIPGGIAPGGQPGVGEFFEQASNYDRFYQQKIIKETDIKGFPGAEGKSPGRILDPTTKAGRVAWKKRGLHTIRHLQPTYTLDIEKVFDAAMKKPDYKGRTRPFGVVLADVIFGIKMYPVDYSEQMTRKISKLDPKKGRISSKLYYQIKTLHVKKNAAKSETLEKIYQKQIDEKTNQIIGLAKELKMFKEYYEESK